MNGFDGDMRDMLGFASHVEVCGIAGLRGYEGYAGYAGRTTSSKSPRPGCRFWGRPPQSKKGGNGNGKQPAIQKKRMLIFDLTCCLSII